jgi:hypothetical protein
MYLCWAGVPVKAVRYRDLPAAASTGAWELAQTAKATASRRTRQDSSCRTHRGFSCLRLWSGCRSAGRSLCEDGQEPRKYQQPNSAPASPGLYPDAKEVSYSRSTGSSSRCRQSAPEGRARSLSAGSQTSGFWHNCKEAGELQGVFAWQSPTTVARCMIGEGGTKCWKFSKSTLQWQIVRTQRNVIQRNQARERTPERVGHSRGSETKVRPGQRCPGLNDPSPVRGSI